MNRVFLIGRLTKDPELRFTPGSGNAVATLTLAVDKYNTATKQREADFIQIVVWGKQAEAVANYMKKGSQMAISGRLQTRSYEAKDGTKRYVTEVVADAYNGTEFLGGKSNGQQSQQEGNGLPNEPYGGNEDMTPVEDSDIPF